MRPIRFSVVAGVVAVCTAATQQPLSAQDTLQPVVYASYYECDPARSARADTLIRTFWGPIVDKHVSAGHAIAWGWLVHHTGGTWDRAFYVVAPDLQNVIRTNEALLEDARTANRAALTETSTACPVHEDYIWQRITGSEASRRVAVGRAPTGYTTYYVCDPARERRADSVFTASIAPVLNRLAQSGDLRSWSWNQHLVGGKYRRMLVTDGPDAATLIEAMGELINELQNKQPAALREFADICNSHQDAVWTIAISRPGAGR